MVSQDRDSSYEKKKTQIFTKILRIYCKLSNTIFLRVFFCIFLLLVLDLMPQQNLMRLFFSLTKNLNSFGPKVLSFQNLMKCQLLFAIPVFSDSLNFFRKNEYQLCLFHHQKVQFFITSQDEPTKCSTYLPYQLPVSNSMSDLGY